MANLFTNVRTYQMSGLALLQNLYGIIANLNSKFKDFQNKTANLGDTVTFDLPPKFSQINSLDVIGGGGFLPAQQRVATLTVNQQIAVPYAVSAQELIFNAEGYLKMFGRSAIAQIGARIEAQVAQSIISSTYRFYGTPSTPVASYGDVAAALAQFRTYGSAAVDVKCCLQDLAVPNIVNTGLQQFVLKRNEEDAVQWMIGDYDNCRFFRSNLLPTHISGNVGNNNTTLTVVSINGTFDQITFSGAAISDANAIKQYDKLYFLPASGINFVTFIGQEPSAAPVQVIATANAASNGAGNVVVSIYPALNPTVGDANQSVTTAVVAGMTVKALPNFRAGVIWCSEAWYLGMPRLPDTTPFPSSSEIDPETGLSIRNYYGMNPFANQYGYVHDAIWGNTLVPEYAMAVIFPY